jgi:hypothetical protein
MSLINDALKKAQRQRSGPLDAPPMPGGSHGGAQGRPSMPPQMLVLALAGAAVVVVISVVATVYFLNRAPAAKPAAKVAVAAAKPALITPAPEPSPVIIAPVIVQAPPAAVELPKTTPVVAEAAPVVAAPAPVPAATTPAPASSAVASAPAPSSAPAPAAAAAAPAAELPLDVRIAMFVDKAHVTGIRASGAGSKVLMNDRVYRLNDVVDRVLGLRLIRIGPDSLTFADASGTIYVKNF